MVVEFRNKRRGFFLILAGFIFLLTAHYSDTWAASAKNSLFRPQADISPVVATHLPAKWHFNVTANGDIQFRNPGHQLNARVNKDGIHLETADGLSVSMQLIKYGYNGALRTSLPQPPRINGGRIDLRHDAALTEWFLNTPMGIEQGFNIDKPLMVDGVKSAFIPNSEFELVFKFSGNLLPEMNADGLGLKDKAGRTRLRYNQLVAYDATYTILPTNLSLAGNHLRLSVNVSSAVYPVIIDPMFTSEFELAASDAEADDQFGTSVVVDGDTVVVGAPLAGSGAAFDSGAVYVFVRDPSTGVFVQQQILTAEDAGTDDQFGTSVFVDGNTIVVGAPLVNSGADFDTGAAYIFTRDPAAGTNPWTQQQKLTAADAGTDDQFGTSVFADGNKVVVGAPLKDSGADFDTGAAYIFTRNPAVDTNPWAQQQKLTAADAGSDDQFGTSVAMEGNTVVVGAPLANLTGAFDAGAVYVFTRDQTKSTDPWDQSQKLRANDPGSDDRFGTSVYADGNTILVGAPLADTPGATDTGAVYVFTRDPLTQSFDQHQILTESNPGSDDQFGSSVFFDGGAAVIGAPLADVGTAGDAGEAYLFTRSPTEGQWSQQQILTSSIPQAQSLFGAAVSLNASTAVVGTPLRDQLTSSDAGLVSGFTLVLEEDEISQETDKLTASDAGEDDNFGTAVALSGDTGVIGAPDSDPDAVSNAGRAHAFNRDPATQVFDQEGDLSANDKDAQDNLGSAVSIDEDTAVIGAPGASVNANTDAGAAYIYSRDPDSGNWSQIEKLTAEGDADSGDEFGTSVSIDSDQALVGAPFHDLDAKLDAGAVFVFSRNPANQAIGQWSPTAKLTADNDAALNDAFGFSIALEGDSALVGAPFANGSGAVFVFACNPADNTWIRQQILTALDATAGDQFGFSVSIHGNTAVIGAPFADVGGLIDAGAVYTFTRDSTQAINPWSQNQKLLANDAAAGDRFGTSVSLVGNTAVLGAPGDDLPVTIFITLVDAGAAYDFRRDPDSGLFSQLNKLTASDANTFDEFGTSVFVNCETYVIGTPGADLEIAGLGVLDNAGAAFIFQTFIAESDRQALDGDGSSGGSSCFINTANYDTFWPSNPVSKIIAIFAALFSLATVLLTRRRLEWKRKY